MVVFARFGTEIWEAFVSGFFFGLDVFAEVVFLDAVFPVVVFFFVVVFFLAARFLAAGRAARVLTDLAAPALDGAFFFDFLVVDLLAVDFLVPDLLLLAPDREVFEDRFFPVRLDVFDAFFLDFFLVLTVPGPFGA